MTHLGNFQRVAFKYLLELMQWSPHQGFCSQFCSINKDSWLILLQNLGNNWKIPSNPQYYFSIIQRAFLNRKQPDWYFDIILKRKVLRKKVVEKVLIRIEMICILLFLQEARKARISIISSARKQVIISSSCIEFWKILYFSCLQILFYLGLVY